MRTCVCKPCVCLAPPRPDAASPAAVRRVAQIIACDVINPDHINVKFDTIGGLEDIKKALVRRLFAGVAPAALTPSPTPRSTTWLFFRSFVRSFSSAAGCSSPQRHGRAPAAALWRRLAPARD